MCLFLVLQATGCGVVLAHAKPAVHVRTSSRLQGMHSTFLTMLHTHLRQAYSAQAGEAVLIACTPFATLRLPAWLLQVLSRPAGPQGRLE
jgi:hypothetical protein